MRLFLALTLPERMLDRLEALQGALPPDRCVPRDNMHLTLAFLGDQPDALVDPLIEEIDQIRLDPIQMTLGRVDLFGSSKSPVVAMTIADCDALTQCHARVQSALARAGIDRQKSAYRPHVTLLRLKRNENPGLYVAPLVTALTPSDVHYPALALGLFRSRLSPDGAEYDALHLRPLPQA